MIDACSKILESGSYAGRDFSSADDYIYLTAKGVVGPGNATGWRAINTTHHITWVVTNVGSIRGTRFGQRKVTPLVEQPLLF